MNLEVQQREKEGIIILDLIGRLVLGPEDLALREHVLSLLAAGKKNVVVNLEDVSHIDTAGLGSLVFCTEKLRASAGNLVLINFRPTEASAANVLKLDTALEVYVGEQEAVNSFFPDRAVPHYDILQLVEELKSRGSLQTQKDK